MGRSVLKVKGYTSEQIKALLKKEDKYKTGIRLYAVYQVSLGVSSRKLEEVYQTSFKQITNWVHRFESEGIEGLIDKPGRGRKSRLSDDQKKELRDIVLNESPTNYQYNSETWTGPLVMELINKKYGISYQKAQVYNILKGLGLTYQRAKGFYPEADLEKQEEFKEELKKTVGKS